MLKTLCFHCRGHGFDPWLGKFCRLQGAANKKKKREKEINFREFSGNPVGSIPGQGTKILPASCQKKKKKVEENCFNNIFKD